MYLNIKYFIIFYYKKMIYLLLIIFILIFELSFSLLLLNMGNINDIDYNNGLISDNDLDNLLNHKNTLSQQKILKFIKKFITSNHISMINNIFEIHIETNNIDDNKYYTDRKNNYLYIICNQTNFHNIILNLILIGCKFKKPLRGSFSDNDIKILNNINNINYKYDNLDLLIKDLFFKIYSN